jgi:hypothetical protein
MLRDVGHTPMREYVEYPDIVKIGKQVEGIYEQPCRQKMNQHLPPV